MITLTPLSVSKQLSIQSSGDSATTVDYMEYVACLVCKEAELMRADEAVLLPTLYRTFIHKKHTQKVYFP